MNPPCPKCKKEDQYSLVDKNYLKLFGRCWDCDKKDWEEGKLPLAVLEERERQALGIN